MNTPAMLSWLFWFSTTGGPPSDTMVLMSAVCAPADPAPTQHKVRNAPQAAPEKCLMTCLATELICDQGVCCKIVEPFRIVHRAPSRGARCHEFRSRYSLC